MPEPEEQLFEDIKTAFGYPETADPETEMDPNAREVALESIEEIAEKLKDAIVAYVESQQDD